MSFIPKYPIVSSYSHRRLHTTPPVSQEWRHKFECFYQKPWWVVSFSIANGVHRGEINSKIFRFQSILEINYVKTKLVLKSKCWEIIFHDGRIFNLVAQGFLEFFFYKTCFYEHMILLLFLKKNRKGFANLKQILFFLIMWSLGYIFSH